MFGPSRAPLGFVRSKVLGVFSIFNVDASDSADILYCLEKVDVEYTQHINVLDFSKLFCEDYQRLFGIVWERYQGICEINIEDPKFYIPEYTHFLCFLLFLMSMNANDVSKYIYFMWFFIPHIIPQMNSSKLNRVKFKIKMEHLDELLNTLWGPTAKGVKKATKYKAKLRRQIGEQNLDQLTYKQFKSFNLMCSVCFSQPLVEMQRKLKYNMIGQALWSRVYKLFQKFVKHPRESIKALDDSEFYFYNTIAKKEEDGNGANTALQQGERKSKTVFRSLGDRKEARSAIQPFLKLLKLYIEMPTEGFKEKVRRSRKQPAEEAVENTENNDENGGDDEDDVEIMEELSLMDTIGLMWKETKKAVFGEPKAKVVPEEEQVNPVVAKYAKYNPSSSDSVVSTVNSDFASKQASSVADVDLDSVVDSIISQQYSLTKMYSNILVEPLHCLSNRANIQRRIAEEACTTVDEDLEKYGCKEEKKGVWSSLSTKSRKSVKI